ncbi:hypothetical protein [Polaromonas eurypsychrophila]|uniref:hypothetical protein n=1 Tax=Polaromonas eurypsychrophila TaxID=1614635 RepID=UPI0016684F50|nr:hypothetical protein [Polaromonas eurypsychrophila]
MSLRGRYCVYPFPLRERDEELGVRSKFLKILSLITLLVLTAFVSTGLLAQVTTYTNRVDPPILSAEDMRERLKFAAPLSGNSIFWKSQIEMLGQKIPSCLWQAPFARQITQQQREMAIDRVQHVDGDTLWPVFSKLPSFPALKARVQKDLASQNTPATLAKANELLKDPVTAEFVHSWLHRSAWLFAFGCGPFTPNDETRLQHEFIVWAITP